MVDAIGSVVSFDPGHAHTASCYWDCRDARWHCGAPAQQETPPAEPAMSERDTAVQIADPTALAATVQERTAVTT